MQDDKLKIPDGKQLPRGVQKPAFSGLTEEFANIYSSAAMAHTSMPSPIVILPL